MGRTVHQGQGGVKYPLIAAEAPGEEAAKPRQSRFRTVCYSLVSNVMNGILRRLTAAGIILILLAKSEAKCDFSLDMCNAFSL